MEHQENDREQDFRTLLEKNGGHLKSWANLPEHVDPAPETLPDLDAWREKTNA